MYGITPGLIAAVLISAAVALGTAALALFAARWLRLSRRRRGPLRAFLSQNQREFEDRLQAARDTVEREWYAHGGHAARR